MKIRNPNFVAIPDANAPHVKHRQAVIDALKAVPEVETLTFAEIRTLLGKSAAQLPNGSIHQICEDAGIKTEE